MEIDGRLDDPVWQQAALVDGFREVEPFEGRPAEHRTEVLMWKSETHLYVGFRFFEPEPEQMVRQNMVRDARLMEDDRIQFVLDTFHDGKTAYFFQLSAAGSRGDALIGDNGSSFNKRWDGFWEGRTWIGPDRWSGEIAIPFRTMAVGKDGRWRANFERYRGSSRTRYRWASPQREYRTFNVSVGGELTGFDDVDQGLGLTFAPYAKAKRLSQHGGSREWDTGFGGEIDWRMTPQLKLSVTRNTDFAETEVDDRQVNLTQYSLFFPEKRDFFLEDANLFDFGPRGFRGRGGNAVIPFFSRRIGLVDGEEVSVDSGVRLSGRAGPWDLGLLAVDTPDTRLEDGSTVPASQMFVLRPKYNLSDRVAIGGLLTHGDPDSDRTNLVTGLDLTYTTPDLFDGLFNMTTYAVRSEDEASAEIGGVVGTRANLTTSNWEITGEALVAQNEFNPGLGFVQRPGQSNLGLNLQWSPRPADQSSSVRKYEFRLNPFVWYQSGRIMSQNLRMTLFGIEWHNGYEFQVDANLQGDRVDDVFDPGGVLVDQGFYHWANARINLQSPEGDDLSWEASLGSGGWYDGGRTDYSFELNWRPGPWLSLSLDYSENLIDLERGDFANRIVALGGDFFYSPQVSWQNLIQFDNDSDELGWQSRLRWIHQDGQELFLVFNAGWEERFDGAIVPQEKDLALKVVYSIRF